MNNKTYGTRPPSRGHVNRDGTVSRPRQRSGPAPSNAPQYKARAVYGAQQPSASPKGKHAAGKAPMPQVRPRVPQRGQRPRTAPPPTAFRSAKPHPMQRPPQQRKGWVYPEDGAQNAAFDFERYYRQRRQAELQRERQRRQAAHAQMLRQKKLRRKRLAAQVRGVLLRFFIVFLLVCGAAVWMYFSVYHSTPREKQNAVTYTIGDADPLEVDGATAYYDGILYVDFTRLAAFLDMPAAGSIHYMRFIIPSDRTEDSAGDGTEEQVLFTVGSFTANINGVNMDMAGPCRLVDTAIWVPLSFVERYMTGVTVEREKSDAVTLTRTIQQEGEGDEPDVLEMLTFRVKAQDPIDSVPYPQAQT